jgi:hypothetical protein
VRPAAAAPPKGIDEVRWVEGERPGVSLLYLVLTEPGARHERLSELVVRHAGYALAEAKKHAGRRFNVAFFVRQRPGDLRGAATGFSVEQLREIVGAEPRAARRLVGRHAWSLGKLPPATRPRPETRTRDGRRGR